MSHDLGHCATCEQWHQINPSQGFCHNRSPVVDPQASIGWMDGKPLYGPKTLWPETGPHDWCGDHMNKIDPDAFARAVQQNSGLPPLGPDHHPDLVASLQERALAPQSQDAAVSADCA